MVSGWTGDNGVVWAGTTVAPEVPVVPNPLPAGILCRICARTSASRQPNKMRLQSTKRLQVLSTVWLKVTPSNDEENGLRCVN